ncbi:MAG: DUF58 domain-containing protein [Anaerolineae bacterium]|nr:DUF58 domain-containing protein [Thermoflexales bacterium]MDW8406146.1 DUF58 domain-containing protein [Anaerolineae bacterium]
MSALLPDLPQADPRAAERVLQRLDWQVIRRLDGLLQGDYRTLFYGYGVDFADLREYQPQDDVRYIDWNVTARMDAPYIRQYVEDREITAWFLLDFSPSVDFGTTRQSRLKRSVLIDLVGTLARLLTRHGNRVGAMLYTTQVERMIPARGGRLHTLRLLHELMRQPPLSHAPLTDLAPLLRTALNSIHRRALILIISDFICAPGWERLLGQLNRRHEVIAVRLWDRSERELPEIGPLILEDAETGEQVYVDTRDRAFRAHFAAAIEQHERHLGATFKRAGVDVLSLSTEDDLVHAIAQFAAAREQRRR